MRRNRTALLSASFLALMLSACAGNISVGPYTLYAGVYGVPIKGAIHDEYTPTQENAPQVAAYTPTPIPARSCVVVARSGVNVRGGAGTQYEVITALRFNARVEYVGTDGEWIEIVSPVGVGRAWVYGALVECEG